MITVQLKYLNIRECIEYSVLLFIRDKLVPTFNTFSRAPFRRVLLDLFLLNSEVVTNRVIEV